MPDVEVVEVTEHVDTVLVIPETETVQLIEEEISVVELTTPGPQGPPGPQGATGGEGPQGPQGPPGVPGGGFQYVHDQAIASAEWTIVHNLSGFPNVAVVDSAGTEVVGHVLYDSPVQLRVQFANGFAGKAYLS